MGGCFDSSPNAGRKTPSDLEDSATSPGGPGEGKSQDPLRPRGLGHLPRWKRGRGRLNPPRQGGLPGIRPVISALSSRLRVCMDGFELHAARR
jgi:hypothetical protein